LYKNTFIADYHKGYNIYHIHETYIFDDRRFDSAFFKIWGIEDGFTYFKNCLLYVVGKQLDKVYYQSGKSKSDNYKFVKSINFTYIMPKPNYWLKGKGQLIESWKNWKKDGREKNSNFFNPTDCFINFTKNDFRLLKKSPASYAGTNESLHINNEVAKINKDFYGKSRALNPSAGAFEAY
jgi:hypothetical protein